MFGFHPEADMHWSEAEGPEPHVGVAGRGKNTWFTGVIKYARVYEGGDHDWLDSGGHRRLQSAGATRATSVTSPAIFRPVVPAAIHWPPMLEPELLASSAHGIIAMAPGGTGTILPGNSAFEGGHSVPFNLGILEMGRAHGLSWSPQGQLLLHTSSGKIASCPVTAAGGSIPCQALDLPPVPGWEPSGIAVVTPAVEPHPFRAAILGDGKVRVHELTTGLTQHWHPTVELQIPHSTSKPVSLSGDHERLVMAMDDGSVFHWLLDGQRTGAAEETYRLKRNDEILTSRNQKMYLPEDTPIYDHLMRLERYHATIPSFKSLTSPVEPSHHRIFDVVTSTIIYPNFVVK